MRVSRHNGRSGKHGVYNPKHNDRRFDVQHSEHIDRNEKRKIFIGIVTMEFPRMETRQR